MQPQLPYRDRQEAGDRLVEALTSYNGRDDVVVLGLPQGGIPLARRVAEALGAPLDIMLVHKLGLPRQPEYAIGAIASRGARVLNRKAASLARLSEEAIEEVAAEEQHQLDNRERRYRGDRPPVSLHGRCAILVDDGLATGATMSAATVAARHGGAASVVVAVPVAPPEVVADLKNQADAVVCPATPPHVSQVGQWYQHFGQISDHEVQQIIQSSDPAKR